MKRIFACATSLPAYTEAVGGYSSTGINGQAHRISLLESNCLMNLRVKSYFSYQFLLLYWEA
ncbi:MAG: hypothetical protein F6K22_35635 [Okeania sp. SIO2F4]|uniref:hypothetical protein n=1 Tax=Okeania sp. SIO2F4 TaxID=2607790 RepID=UPI00142AE16E|nr:hypothetical protein [Okeania sp. SIO2F4]NES07650.1 hypothetical protein [Okeania sp. SIO2F4]